MLCVAAACAIGCGDRSSATKREREAAPVAPPPASSNQPAVPASAQSGPQRPNDPSLLRDEEGLIGVQNSSGRSGAFYVPGGSGINGLPLLVILHGTGQSGSDMIATFRDLAKARRLAIVAPDSRDHSGQLTWEVGDKPGDVTPDLTHTLDCIAWVRSHVGFLADESHVLIAGYSGGGSSAPYVATNRDGFTHAAVLHGGVFPGGVGSRHIPVWFSTGQQDRYRPVDLVRQSVDALTTLGFSDLTFRTYPGGHELSDSELNDLITWWLGR